MSRKGAVLCPAYVAHAVCPVYTVPPAALTGKAMRRLPTLDQAVREWEGGRLGPA